MAVAEIDELITNAFALFSALFALYERCRRSLLDFKDAFLPYDRHYKGVMQLLFDQEDILVGFRVYWPNGTYGEYARTKNASTNLNLRFDPDGSVNFMVGLYASRRGIFSPLVEHDAEPVYSSVPGTNLTPHWPQDLKPYKLT